MNAPVYARIDGGAVVEIIQPAFADEDIFFPLTEEQLAMAEPPKPKVDISRGGLIAIERRFHPDLLAQFVPVPEDIADTVAVGWLWSGSQFLAPLAPAPLVPRSVTMRQARLALLKAGLLKQVDDAIAALPEEQRQTAQIEWEFASTVERDSAFVAGIGAALGLDAAALDALFTEGAKL